MKKKNNNQNIKIIFIAIGICLFIIISIFVCVYSLEKDEPVKIEASVKQDIENIINNLGSKFIAQKQSEEAGFIYDIYLEFKEDIYVDGKSNERLYTNLMSQVISNLKVSVRFIDESQDLIIRATFDKEESKYYYTVNGEDNYFSKMDSINSLNRRKDSNNTDMKVNSIELKNIIASDWDSSSVNIDENKTVFNEYDQYFYTGINIKNMKSKVYNVVFDNKYKDNVINGIKVGTSLERVSEILGEPTFEKDSIYGYKNDEFYVFFSQNEISIYRNEIYNTEDFTELLVKYLDNEINLKSFMNELTYLWENYSKYEYNSNYLLIEYPLQGVRINMSNSEDKLGIEIYDNFQLNEIIEFFIKEKRITSKVDKNLYSIVESDRIHKISNEKYGANILRASMEADERSNIYNYYCETNNKSEIISVRFYSLDDSFPYVELKENVYTLVWISDTEIIYSIKNKGIYYYNIQNNQKQEILKGEDEYNIVSYSNNILKYDDNEIQIEEE